MDQIGVILLHCIQEFQKFFIRVLALFFYNRNRNRLKIGFFYFSKCKVKEGGQEKRKYQGPEQHIEIMQFYFDIIFH